MPTCPGIAVYREYLSRAQLRPFVNLFHHPVVQGSDLNSNSVGTFKL